MYIFIEISHASMMHKYSSHGENSLHTLKSNKGKASIIIAPSPALANAQRGAVKDQRFDQLLYISALCLPYILSTLNLFQVLAPGYTLSNLNRDWRLSVWSHRQTGGLHSIDTTGCQNYFKHTSDVLFG